MVDALSNDIDGLSNFLKQVTGQCSVPDPGECWDSDFIHGMVKKIVHLDRIREVVYGAQLHGGRVADLGTILQTSFNPCVAL
jgi:hypothetical protein